MQIIRTHIIGKVLVILLSMFLLAPLAVKLNHIFEDHKHEVCKTPNKLHFHNLQLDCKFYDFRLNTYYYQSPEVFEIFDIEDIQETMVSQYHFISHYQRLQFSLRGPPSYV
jgi:hypothetical protein